MKIQPNLIHYPKTLGKSIIRVLLLFLLINIAMPARSQETGSDEKEYHLSGLVTATNNGISVIPSFSLGKPAFMFEFSIGGEKLSFDPQLRFAMNGKPWSFVFWWRYQFVNNDKFGFRVGAHPAFMFSDLSFDENESTIDVIEARRFAAFEVAPSFKISDKVTFRPYLLTAHGFSRGIQNSVYFTLITSVSDLNITDNITFSMVPQVFYLKMDENDGYYLASAFSLSHKKSPVYLASMMNYKIKSEIASKDFLWNVSLVYSFSNTFKKNK